MRRLCGTDGLPADRVFFQLIGAADAGSGSVMRKLLFIGVFSALLAGCSMFVPKLEKPRLSLASVQVQEGSGLLQQKLLVGVRVTNPNARELPVKGIDLRLELAGEHVADGVTARSFVVPANSEAQFDMVVTANLAAVLMKLATHRELRRDEIPYRVTGKVATSIGMLRSIPFNEAGSIPLGLSRD
jgi:LEA14-like dessication related protein